MLSLAIRLAAFQVEAVGGLLPDPLLADELSGTSFEGKWQVLTSGTEREPRPFTWQKGDHTLTA